MAADTSRKIHAEHLLATRRDLWLATSSRIGPHLVPLSFLWHENRVLFATSATSRTGRNVLENRQARGAVGDTRDLVIVTGVAQPADLHDEELSRVFADRLGFGPAGGGTDGTLFVLTPLEIQTWVERADRNRWVMRNGEWVV